MQNIMGSQPNYTLKQAGYSDQTQKQQTIEITGKHTNPNMTTEMSSSLHGIKHLASDVTLASPIETSNSQEQESSKAKKRLESIVKLLGPEYQSKTASKRLKED